MAYMKINITNDGDNIIRVHRRSIILFMCICDMYFHICLIIDVYLSNIVDDY